MPPSHASLPVVHLDDDRLSRGPWVYARRVRDAPGVEDGSVVEVHDASDRFVGHALWNGRSDIRLRWLARERRNALDRPRDLLLKRLKAADDLRRRTLRIAERTDAYRVVHGEADDLPGLVVDKLGPVLVCEHHALGFWRLRDDVGAALGQLYRDVPVVHRVPGSAVRAEGFDERDLPPEGEVEEVVVQEDGIRFPVRPGGGHKTGFFCDQRENRRLVATLAPARRMLDLCTNSGGFALHAARAGARAVEAVDLDEVALERAERAGALNELEVAWRHADAFDHLREARAANREWDLVVVDPPKLAPNRNAIERALVKYGDLNALAIGATRPGGLVATFSCSGAVDLPAFLGVVFHAARRAERGVRLLSILGPGPDHPQRPDHPRSRYLKGALLAVDA